MKVLIFLLLNTLAFSQGINPENYYPQTYMPMPVMPMYQAQPQAPVIINIINGQAQPTQQAQQNLRRRGKNLGVRLRNMGAVYTGYSGYKHYKRTGDIKSFLKSGKAKIGVGTMLFSKPLSKIPGLKHLLKLR